MMMKARIYKSELLYAFCTFMFERVSNTKTRLNMQPTLKSGDVHASDSR